MTHKRICYDDEGRLVCCCETDSDLQAAQELSAADAHILVTEHQVAGMSMLFDALDSPTT